jgi:hypothetical protein
MAQKSRGNSYTAGQLEFIRATYQLVTLPDLVEAYNRQYGEDRTLTAMKSTLCNHKITCGGQGQKDNWQHTKMTRAQDAWLEAHYVDISVKDIAQQFNQLYDKDLTREQMKAYIATRGFKSGRTGCYAKGNTPTNKDCEHRPGYAPGRMGSTQFKAGPRPDMRLPIGHERVDKDGYILVKVDMINPHTGIQGYYVPKQKVVWEAVNGPVPKNHVLTFIDDDTSNPVLENLELITRSELCRRNKMQYKQADPEIRDTIKTIAKLQYTTALRGKE